MKDDFTKAKPGTKLYSTAHGWGYVDCVRHTDEYPITMQFPFPLYISFQSFTATGRLYDNPDAPQVLFWDDPKIVPPPRPKTKVKRWIKGRYDEDGTVFLAGCGMRPMFFDTKQDAEKQDYRLETAFIVEVEVYEESCDG